MPTLILKLLEIVILYVLVAALTWKVWSRRPARLGGQICVGLIFGLCAVLSNHLAAVSGSMRLSIRDIGPLTAGLFFHPLSGVIAGVISGAERWLIGEYAGIGAYTQLASCLSALIAGFLPVPLWRFAFRGKHPSSIHAFIIGAFTEVLYIYLIFLTHPDETRSVYEVIHGRAFPMILLVGLGLAACSLTVRHLAGEPIEFIRPSQRWRRPLSHQFQFWLLLGTLIMFLVNFGVTYVLQSRTALENVRYRLEDSFSDLESSYIASGQRFQDIMKYIDQEQLKDARLLSRIVKALGGADASSRQLDSLRTLSELDGLYLVDAQGQLLQGVGAQYPGLSELEEGPSQSPLSDVLTGSANETVLCNSFSGLMSVTACDPGLFLCCYSDYVDHMIEIPFVDYSQLFESSSLPEEARFQAFIVQKGEDVLVPCTGTLNLSAVTSEQKALLLAHENGEVFYTDLFGAPALCKFAAANVDEPLYLLVLYSADEAYASRNASMYENTFSDILLFITIYLIITVLMERLVVTPLSSVNASLTRITAGDLSEKVSVRTSAEFDTLSADINTTVDALKGYIHAAEKRMEQELQLAREIQASALPRNFTFPGTHFDLYALMDPAKEVGGDFYDFFFVDSRHFALVIADVSGKGVPASLFMMRAKAAIRNLATSGNSPADIFSRANDFLCDGNDAEMFVTAWIGIIDLETGEMQCANAGHEYPALSTDGKPYVLFRDRHSMALATMEGIPMRQYSLQLNPGDRIFVYTDGVPEAINEQQEAYGTSRLIGLLNEHLDLTAQELLPLIRGDVSDFAGKAEQFDDITMLEFTWFGPGEPSA